MTDSAPIPQIFTYQNGVLVPLNRELAARQFAEGETYRLGVHEDRSAKSHRQLFAVVAEAFDQLPQSIADELFIRTPDDLRKYCLIKAGHCDYECVLTGSDTDAKSLAEHFRPRHGEGFALVVVKGPTIHRFWASSISERAVDRAHFQKIKEDVFQILAEMLDVEVDTLIRNTGQAA